MPIEAGTQIVALDQQWGDQAGFGALACAELLKNGKVLPNTQHPEADHDGERRAGSQGLHGHRRRLNPTS